jgi:hypothetical protein
VLAEGGQFCWYLQPMGPIYIIELTVNIRKRNGTQYSKSVSTEVEFNQLRNLGVINGANNLKAVNMLVGNQFLGEEIVSYHSYKQTPK